MVKWEAALDATWSASSRTPSTERNVNLEIAWGSFKTNMNTTIAKFKSAVEKKRAEQEQVRRLLAKSEAECVEYRAKLEMIERAMK